MNPNPGLYDTKVEAPFTFTLQNTLHAHRHSMPLLSEHGVVMSILVRLLVHEAIAPMALPPTNDDAMRFLTESTTTGQRITNPLVLDALCRLVYDVFMDLHQQWLACPAAHPDNYLLRLDFGIFDGIVLTTTTHYWTKFGGPNQSAPRPQLALLGDRYR